MRRGTENLAKCTKQDSVASRKQEKISHRKFEICFRVCHLLLVPWTPMWLHRRNDAGVRKEFGVGRGLNGGCGRTRKLSGFPQTQDLGICYTSSLRPDFVQR